TVGVYVLEYKYIDSSTNVSNIVTRTVNIVDTTSPILTLNGSGTVTIERLSPYIELGADWTDNVDGTGIAIVGGDTVNTTSTGIYIVTYDYTDTSLNVATQIIRTVTVIDTTSPTASIIYSSTGATNQDVIATLTGASEPITITNNSGSTN
ncbi:MAG: DUF5011 domain-containing protein, partial [Candidatus Gracilibacteria bacterium]|nr:DUF5011 domain-containing protein [Candidatus Gracilibacteria bacterium]